MNTRNDVFLRRGVSQHLSWHPRSSMLVFRSREMLISNQTKHSPWDQLFEFVRYDSSEKKRYRKYRTFRDAHFPELEGHFAGPTRSTRRKQFTVLN